MYYLRQQTQISGPFTVEQLTSLLHRGRVARSDKISADKKSWIRISECPEIVQRPVAPTQSTPAVEWFYTRGGAEQPNPVGADAILAMLAAGSLGSHEMVWRDGFDGWRPLVDVPEFAAAVALPPITDPTSVQPLPPVNPDASGTPVAGPDFHSFVGKKVAAGVTAIVLGPLGIHKFILGLTTGGVSMLLLCLLVVPIPFLSIVGFVEGLLYLTKTDDAFYRDYAVARKQWF